MSVYFNDDIVFVTPEQIKEFSEYCSSIDDSVLNESSIINESLDQFLDNAIFSIDNASKSINECAKEIAEIIKQGGIKLSTAKEINESFQKCLKKISISFDEKTLNSKFGEYESSKIQKSIILLITVVFINSIIDTTLLLLFRGIGNKIAVGIICPIVEELSKTIAAKGGFETEFAVVFNSFEFTSYVMKSGPLIGFKNMIILRLKTVGMHLFTSIIHWITNNKQVLEKFGIKKEDEATVNLVGQIIGVIIHATWNIMAVTNNKAFLKVIYKGTNLEA